MAFGVFMIITISSHICKREDKRTHNVDAVTMNIHVVIAVTIGGISSKRWKTIKYSLDFSLVQGSKYLVIIWKYQIVFLFMIFTFKHETQILIIDTKVEILLSAYNIYSFDNWLLSCIVIAIDLIRNIANFQLFSVFVPWPNYKLICLRYMLCFYV